MSAGKETILVTGAGGQLGHEITELSREYTAYNFLFTDVATLKIDDEDSVIDYFATHKIDHIINAAAYTAVDKAETDLETAHRVNAEATGILARAAARANATFIHVSTDYVFSGKADKPYKETDQVDPVNAYGASKLAGEKLAMKFYDDSIVIRTSWLYSSVGNNFVKTMIRLMNDKATLNVVSDQFGCPTYAADLAEAIMHIIDSGKGKSGGIYHFSNTGVISWFDFASEIARMIETSCVVRPISSAEYPTPAARPCYSAFDLQKIAETFGIKLKPWKESLEKCIKLLV